MIKLQDTTPEIVTDQDRALTVRDNVALTPMDMIDRAVGAGASVETLGKLMDLQERWEKNHARKAFDAAIAAAKSEIPVIIKNREVDFTSQKGRTHYRHEDMAGIARVVDPILAKNGLSYRYRTSSNPNEPIGVTCVLSHRDGHSEETSLCAGRDDTGNKNSIQGIGSTITYLQRYTLKAALGLAASDDDDGAAAGSGESVNEAQIAELVALCDEVGADKPKFCRYMNIESLAALPAARFQQAVDALNARTKS